MKLKSLIPVLFLLIAISCINSTQKVEQWTSIEIALEADNTYKNAYTDVDVWAIFSDGNKNYKRPAFWDGNNTWKIRFAPNSDNKTWTWESFSSTDDKGLSGQKGTFKSVPYTGSNQLIKNGLLKMSEGHRNVIHANQKPFFLIGDTPWALPFRATNKQAETYAAYRKAQGYNAALLMTVQPDMNAEGPEARDTDLGFERGFYDLHEGHINELNVAYFQYFDSLSQTLLKYEIVPVYQPVFHGFGWKGLKVLGNVVEIDEYVRYCKYLLARYGASPAFWLVSGDSNGLDPGIGESGEMFEEWDCYQQPTGIHYNPCGDWLAPWASPESNNCFHYDSTFQSANWLDFQWTQTGHNGENIYRKTNYMYNYKPIKAVANGETTYEGMGGGKLGLGWWQGDEAWQQFMHGGTMGVVYGAASLWQWKISDNEEGWGDWSSQAMNWEKAMKMEGAKYVGYMAKALQGLDLTDIEKHPELTSDNQLLLAKPGKLYISYLSTGGTIEIDGVNSSLRYKWFNPMTGTFEGEPQTVKSQNFSAPGEDPWVLIISE